MGNKKNGNLNKNSDIRYFSKNKRVYSKKKIPNDISIEKNRSFLITEQKEYSKNKKLIKLTTNLKIKINKNGKLRGVYTQKYSFYNLFSKYANKCTLEDLSLLFNESKLLLEKGFDPNVIGIGSSSYGFNILVYLYEKVMVNNNLCNNLLYFYLEEDIRIKIYNKFLCLFLSYGAIPTYELFFNFIRKRSMINIKTFLIYVKNISRNLQKCIFNYIFKLNYHHHYVYFLQYKKIFYLLLKNGFDSSIKILYEKNTDPDVYTQITTKSVWIFLFNYTIKKFD